MALQISLMSGSKQQEVLRTEVSWRIHVLSKGDSHSSALAKCLWVRFCLWDTTLQHPRSPNCSQKSL